MTPTVERPTDQIRKAAASARSGVAQLSGPSLAIAGLVQVAAAFSPTTTIGHIAQGVAFTVLGILVWETKLKEQRDNSAGDDQK